MSIRRIKKPCVIHSQDTVTTWKNKSLGFQLAMLFALTGCGPAAMSDFAPAYRTQDSPISDKAPACAPAPRMVVFGDSFSAIQPGYTVGLADRLGKTLEDHAVTGTQLTESAQWRAVSSFTYRRTDTIVMMVGFNDSFDHQTDPAAIEAFKEKLRFVIGVFTYEGLPTYIATPSYMTDASYTHFGKSPDGTDTYAQAIRDVMAEGSHPTLKLVDVTLKFGHPTANMISEDHIHPTADGFKVLEDIFYEEMK